jgi:Tfp pilus assembly protein PilZ
MEEKQKIPEQVIKKVILYVIFSLSLISLILISQNLIQKESFFLPTKTFIIPFILIMLVLMWVVSIISLTVNDKELAILVLIYFLISSGIIVLTHPQYLVGPVITLLLVLSGLTMSKKLKEDLIKVNIIKISKPTIKNLRVSVSILISIMLLFSYSKTPASEINIGEKVVEIVGPSIDKLVEQEAASIVVEQQDTESIINPNISSILSNLGMSQDVAVDTPYQIKNSVTHEIKEGIKSQVSKQINRRVEPYKDLLFPAIVILSFFTIQIYSYISYLIYLLTINIILEVLKRSGFLKSEIKQVEKENIVL